MKEKLEIVQKSTGAACLVTIGTGPKIFSTGFDLPEWKKNKLNGLSAIGAMQVVLKKILLLPMPTMCVMNGHAYAGGLILALAHDFRILGPKGTVCLSEIVAGLSLAIPYQEMVNQLIEPNIRAPML